MSVNLGETKITDIFKTTGGTGGTSDYNELTNKPQINGVTLTGNKTSEDLGIITGITDAYTKEETQALIESSITGKADKTYVDGQLDLKADKSTTYTKTEVDNSISSITQNINNKLANKADKSDTYTKEETISAIQSNTTNKADITYVDAQLNLKADKSDTYTKEEVDDMFDNPTITGDTLPIGSITLWSGSTTPTNWLLCDGREVSRETYSELFAAIGTIWGAGDGSTSFNLPDFTDKFTLGAGGDVDLAETGGEKEVTLTVEQIPPHTHTLPGAGGGSGQTTFTRVNTEVASVQSYSTGGGQPHNNMPPYVGSYYIIKAKQSAGVIATVVDTLESSSTTDALSANMGKKLANMDKNLTPVTLFETDKTYENIADNTVITLNDDITNYKRIKVYGNISDGMLGSVEIFKPQVGDSFSVAITRSGSRSGYYAFSITYRDFQIISKNQIKYGDATQATSHTASQSNLVGFVADGTYLKIYAIIGFKN